MSASPASPLTEWRAFWPLVVMGMAGMSLATIVAIALQVTIPHLEREFGWTRAEISSGGLILSISGIVMSALGGYAIDRFGARLMGIVTVLSTCAMLVLSATMNGNLWLWWLLWAFFSVPACLVPTIWVTPVSSLFNTSRGLAVAMSLSGSGVAAMIGPLVTHYLVESFGWRAGYVCLAALWGMVTVPLVLLVWRGAEDVKARAAPAAEKSASPAELPGVSLKEGFASPTLYLIGFAALISSVGSVGLVMNLVPVLVSTGITPVQAAAVAGVWGVAILCGRFIGGWLMDQLNAKLLVIASVLLSGSLPVALLIAPGSIPISMLGIFATGFMGGVKSPAIVYLVSRYFGARSFGTISTASAIASGVGPMLANLVFDATNAYTAVLWGSLPCFLIAAAVLACLGDYPAPPAKPAAIDAPPGARGAAAG